MEKRKTQPDCLNCPFKLREKRWKFKMLVYHLEDMKAMNPKVIGGMINHLEGRVREIERQVGDGEEEEEQLS